jgi:hypothetical protein
MFFRLKKTRSGHVLKLLESYRDAGGTPRHRTVASLGDAPLPEADWRAVADAVAGRLHGHGELVAPDLSARQREWADRIVRQVEGEGRWPAPARAWGEVVDGVLLDRVGHAGTAELGPALAGWRAWNRLGMPELLETLGFGPSQAHAAAVSVINRLSDPSSEHGLADWYRRTGMAELTGRRLRGAGDDRFYRVSDRLLARQREIEAHLRERQRSLFGLGRTVLLYDLTNSHFEGVCAGNPKARRGRNKQKRHDCPQIVVGVVFDGDGFALAHRVFEGNLHDAAGLRRMLGDLKEAAGKGAGEPLVVMDGGVASRENLDLLRGEGFGYLAADRRPGRGAYAEAFASGEGFTAVGGRDGRPPVEVRAAPSSGKDAPGERVVLCRSGPRGEKEKAILSRAEARFRRDAEKLAARVASGRLKVPEKIQRAVGRLLAGHPRAARYYDVRLEEAGGTARLAWDRSEEAMEDAEDLCGCYVLRASGTAMDPESLWRLYMTLTRAEDGFRALKTELGLRPNPHRREDRVDGHVFICVLAYQLLRLTLRALEDGGDRRSWGSVRRVLRTHCYTTILLPTRAGTTHRIRRAGEPDEEQKAIYRLLDIDWTSLPVLRTVTGAREAPSIL